MKVASSPIWALPETESLAGRGQSPGQKAWRCAQAESLSEHAHVSSGRKFKSLNSGSWASLSQEKKCHSGSDSG